MMNVVMPIAGLGKRFSIAGYQVSKPFITVDNFPMFLNVIRNMNIKEATIYTFICLEEFVEKVKHYLNKTELNSQIITIKNVTEGAACSVLLAKDTINNDQELIIVNCDQIILDNDYINNALKYYRKHKVDGGILCFLNDSSKYSYARLHGEKIIEVVEKQVVSNIATCGLYYYRKGSDFVNAAEDMINKNIRVSNEFYIAPTYNKLIMENKKVVPYLVNEFFGIGTPEDLKIYESL